MAKLDEWLPGAQRPLIAVLITLVCIPIAGIVVGDNLISLGAASLGLIGITAIFGMLGGRISLDSHDLWMSITLAFLALAAVGLAFAPLRDQHLEKGILQILAMGAVALGAVGISHLTADRDMIYYVVRLYLSVATVLAIVGLAQWTLSNVFGNWEAFNLLWLNDMYGKTVWRFPGTIGPNIYRVNSLAGEPAHFVRIIAPAASLAVMRLGLVGRYLARHTSFAIGRLRSFIILGAFVASGSLVGYLLILTILAVLIALNSSSWSRKTLGIITLLGTSSLAIIVGSSADLFSESRISTVSLILQPIHDAEVSTSGLSALAISTNRTVAFDNFARSPILGIGMGGHPETYWDFYGVNGPLASQLLQGLNSEDAASMGLRLISETGALGAILYYSIFLSILVRLRRSVSQPTADPQVRAYIISVGASLSGLVIADMIRYPSYFDPLTWTLVGLATAGITVLNKKSGALMFTTPVVSSHD